MKNFKKIHLLFGFIVLIIFILTGQYMHHKYNHLVDMTSTERALFRAGHIYILFSSFVHISLGNYFKSSNNKLKKSFQFIGSFFLIIATILIIYSFFTELPTNKIERIISRLGIYLTLAGILFHSAINLLKDKDEKNKVS